MGLSLVSGPKKKPEVRYNRRHGAPEISIGSRDVPTQSQEKSRTPEGHREVVGELPVLSALPCSNVCLSRYGTKEERPGFRTRRDSLNLDGRQNSRVRASPIQSCSRTRYVAACLYLPPACPALVLLCPHARRPDGRVESKKASPYSIGDTTCNRNDGGERFDVRRAAPYYFLCFRIQILFQGSTNFL